MHHGGAGTALNRFYQYHRFYLYAGHEAADSGGEDGVRVGGPVNHCGGRRACAVTGVDADATPSGAAHPRAGAGTINTRRHARPRRWCEVGRRSGGLQLV